MPDRLSVLCQWLSVSVRCLCIANEPRTVVRRTTGARTCAPAMEIISDTARSNIPALGYAGTYAIANVLLTLAGTIIVMVWPGLG
ncbi:hypothetical protein ACLK2I_04525 [Escherichia coli]